MQPLLALIQRYAIWIILAVVLAFFCAGGAAIYFYLEAHQVEPVSLPAQIQSPIGRAIHVQAQTPEKQVLWHVCKHSSLDVETLPAPDAKSFLLLPHQAGTIRLHAVVSHKGQPHLAECTITVGDAPQPGPTPIPVPVPPAPPKPIGPLHVTIVVDESSETASQAALIGSSTIRQKLTAGGHKLRVYNQSSPTLVSKGLSALVATCGTPCVIFQTQDGRAVPSGKAQKLPATEADFLTLLAQAGG